MIDFLKGTVTPKDWATVAGILAVTATLIIGFYFVVHQHQKAELLQIQTDDGQVFGDLHQARRINTEIDSLREETERIEKLVTEFEERLPSRRELPTLLKEFENMASEEDIDVELSPLSRSKDMRKETIPYSIVARGDYHQVVSFINRLERFKRYLKISDLNIGQSVQGVTTARFTLNTYRFLQAKAEEVS